MGNGIHRDTLVHKARCFVRVGLLAIGMMWSMQINAQTKDYFKFTALADNCKVELGTRIVSGTGYPPALNLWYSTDQGQSWTYCTGMANSKLLVNLPHIGDEVWIKGMNLTSFSNRDKQWSFRDYTTGSLAVSGNIMSIVDSTMQTKDIPTQFYFYRLFEGCSALKDASGLILPAEELPDNCYNKMFYSCTNLTKGPDMSAVRIIGEASCQEMFSTCSNLQETVDMPNLTMVEYRGCYKMYLKDYKLQVVHDYPSLVKIQEEGGYYMFSNCTTLVNAPSMPNLMTVQKNGCAGMYSGCKALKNVPHLTAQTILQNGYYQMFNGCTALEIAPSILATEIMTADALKEMYNGCTALKFIEVYFTEWNENVPTNNWTNKVTENKNYVFSAPCDLSPKWNDKDYSYIPKKWKFECFAPTYTFDVATNCGYWADFEDNIPRIFKDTVIVPPIAKKTDAVFVEWNTEPDGSGVSWDPKNKPGNTHTFYAIFEDIGIHDECLDYTNLSMDNPNVEIDTASFYTTYDRYWRPVYHLRNFVKLRRSMNYGYNRSDSRYSIHSNPRETDPRTNDQLKTTLPDGRPSVRLGNWELKEAERIIYTYTVPEDKAILTLYYAAILEDPNHNREEQPQFSLEVKKDGEAFMSECFSFQFIPGTEQILHDETWHKVTGGKNDIYWKDWTTMGVNLSDYKGQTIQLILTTYDCSHGGHFGYAYFGLDCQNGEMRNTTCGDVESIDFHAPLGFEYRWYPKGEDPIAHPKEVLSRNQTYTYSGSDTLLCDVMNPQDTGCYFTLEAIPERRYPLARFDTLRTLSEDGLTDTIHITNLSGVSKDGETLNDPREDVDSCYWVVRNMATPADTLYYSSEKEPTFVFEDEGEYKIELKAFLNDGECESEVEWKIVEVRREPEPCEDTEATLEADEPICEAPKSGE